MVRLLHRRRTADDGGKARRAADTRTAPETPKTRDYEVITTAGEPESRPTGEREAPPAGEPDTAPAPAPAPAAGEAAGAERREPVLAPPEPVPESVMRVPTFSLLSPILGWLLAWGVTTIAATAVEQAGVDTGFNLGIASGGPGDDGFFPGLWLLIISFGAFLAGGYAVARMARTHGILHALIMWGIAVIATIADAIAETVRDGSEGVIRLMDGIPFWAETGLTDGTERVLVLGIFAAAQLVGAFVGGSLGQTANRIDRSDDVILTRW